MVAPDNSPSRRNAADPSRPAYVPPYYPRPRNWMLVSLVTLLVLAGVAFALLMWLTPTPP
jgi:hypothetical protein